MNIEDTETPSKGSIASTVSIWPTTLLAEEYLRRFPGRFHGRTLIVGVKGPREVPFCGGAAAAGLPVTVVEAWPVNAAIARRVYTGARVLETSITSFIDRCELGEEPFPDVVVWIQGPEHVGKVVALQVLETFRRRAKLVLAEMPHGKHVQGADGGNPWEEHHGYLYVDDFDPELWDIAVSFDLKRKEDLEAVNDHTNVRHLLVASKEKP